MKNKKIILTICISILAAGCIIAYYYDHNNNGNVITSTNANTIAEMFPNLKGIESTEWEQIDLGNPRSITPGPSDFRYQGYITLSDEAADYYEEAYIWEPDTPDTLLQRVKMKGGSWKSSEAFTNGMVPDYCTGKIWRNGNTLFFSMITM